MLSELLLKQLNEFRLKGFLCDLVISANDSTSFQLHQLVFIALNRRHFQLALKRAELKEDLFTHKKMYMHLTSLTAVELRLLVEFLYGSKTGKKIEYDMLVEALKKVDMMYLLEEAGEFILEDDSLSIKKEVENLPVDDYSSLSCETSDQTQNIHDHGADVEEWTLEKNSETEQSCVALDSTQIKQEPFSPGSSEYTSIDSNSAEAEMCFNETTDLEGSTDVDTITENQVDANEIVNSVLVTSVLSKTGQFLREVKGELNLGSEHSNHLDMYDEIKAESCTSLSSDITSKDEGCKQSVTNHSYTNEVLSPNRTEKMSESLQDECSILTDNFVASPTKLRQLLPKPVVYVSQGPKPIAYLCHGPTFSEQPSSLLRRAVTSGNILPAPVISVASLHTNKKSLPPLTSSVVLTSKLNSASESLSSFVSVASTTEPVEIQAYSGKCLDFTSGSRANSELHPKTMSVSNSCDLTVATTKTSTILKTTVLHNSASPPLNTTISTILNTLASPVLHTMVSPAFNNSVLPVLSTTASTAMNTTASSVLNTTASTVLKTTASSVLNSTASAVLNTTASTVLKPTALSVLNTTVSSFLNTTASSVLNTRATSVPNTTAPCVENSISSSEVNITVSQVESNTFFTGTKDLAKSLLNTTDSLARNGDPSAVLHTTSKRNPNTTGIVRNSLNWKPLFKKSKVVEIKCSKENPLLSHQISKEATKHTEPHFPPVFEKEDGSEYNDLEETEVLVESAASFLKISAQTLVKKENDDTYKTGAFSVEESKEFSNNKEDEESPNFNSECKLKGYFDKYAYDSDKPLESQSQKCIIPSSEILTLTFEQILAAKKKKEIEKSSEDNSSICTPNKNGEMVMVSESCVVNKEVSSSVKAAIDKRCKLLNYLNNGEQNASDNSFNDFITPAEATSKGCIIPLSEICTLSPDDIRAAKKQKTYTIGEKVSKNLSISDSLSKSTSEKQKGNDLQKQSTGCCLSKECCSFTHEGRESAAHRKRIMPRVVTKVVSSALPKNKETSGAEVVPSAVIKNKETSEVEFLDVSGSLAGDKGNNIHEIKAEAEESEVSNGIDSNPDQENIKYQKGMNLEEALNKERQAMHDIYGYESDSTKQTKVSTFQPEILKVQMRPILPSQVPGKMSGHRLPLNSCSIKPKMSVTLMRFPLSVMMRPSDQATVFVTDKQVLARVLNTQSSTNFVDRKKLGKTEKTEEKRKRHKSLHEGLFVEKDRKIKRLKRSCSQEHMKRYLPQKVEKSITYLEQDSSDDETDIPLSKLKERIDSAKQIFESVVETVSANSVIDRTKNQSEEVEISEELESLCFTTTADQDNNVELQMNEIRVSEKPENFKDRTDISDNTYGFCYQTQKFLCKECVLKGTCMCTHTDIKFYGPVVNLTKTECQTPTGTFSLGVPGVIQENKSRRVSTSDTTPELKKALMAPLMGGTRNGDKQVIESCSKKCNCDDGYCVIDKNSGICQVEKKKAGKNEMKYLKNQKTREKYDLKVKAMQEKLLSGKAERKRLNTRKRRMESLKKKMTFHADSCLKGTNITPKQSSNPNEEKQVISFQCSGSISKAHVPQPVILQYVPIDTQHTVTDVSPFSIKDSTLSASTSKTNPVTASLNKECTLVKSRRVLPKLSSQPVSPNLSSVAILNLPSPVITSYSYFSTKMSEAASAASYTWSRLVSFPTVTSSASVVSPAMSSVLSSNTKSPPKLSKIALATPVLTSILTSQPLGSVLLPSGCFKNFTSNPESS